MAGCLPEYFPVVVAAVEALTEPDFNLHGVQTTTSPVAPVAIINGPIRHELGINCTWGCLGPGYRANATIGRAIRFVLLNLGGGLPGDVDKSCMGLPAKYTFCFGEDEEGSAWEPLHVERGFDRGQSTVTVFGVHDVRSNVVAGADGRNWMKVLAHTLGDVGSVGMWVGKGEPVMLLTSAHSSSLAAQGLSKADVKRFIYEHASVPVERVLEIRGEARKDLMRVVDGKSVPCANADDIMVVVAGGTEPIHLMVMSSWGETRAQTKVIPSGKQ
ncbi:hypothetical protein ACFLWV_03440 [Chloroflexota bacterium]